MPNQNSFFPFLLANQAKQQLESRNVAVESDFITRQFLFGWLLDNPWLYAFLLQNDTQRLVSDGFAKRDADISSLKADKQALENQIISKDAAILALEKALDQHAWKKLESTFYQSKIKVSLKNSKVKIEGLLAPRTQGEEVFKQDFLLLLAEHFDKSAPASSPLGAAWRKLEADFNRPEVKISLVTGSFIEPDPNVPTTKQQTPKRWKEVFVVIEELTLTQTADNEVFKEEWLDFLWRYFDSQNPRPTKSKPAQPPVQSEKTQPVVTNPTPLPASRKSAVAADSTILADVSDDLLQIHGIGKAFAEALNQHGIFTFADLAGKTTQELEDILELTPVRRGMSQPENWIVQAQMLAEGRIEEWQAWLQQFKQKT